MLGNNAVTTYLKTGERDDIENCCLRAFGPQATIFNVVSFPCFEVRDNHTLGIGHWALGVRHWAFCIGHWPLVRLDSRWEKVAAFILKLWTSITSSSSIGRIEFELEKLLIFAAGPTAIFQSVQGAVIGVKSDN